MAMFIPSQSHSGGVIVKPYTGNIAQELQFLTGAKKTTLWNANTVLCEPLSSYAVHFTLYVVPFILYALLFSWRYRYGHSLKETETRRSD